MRDSYTPGFLDRHVPVWIVTLQGLMSDNNKQTQVINYTGLFLNVIVL